MGQQWGKKRPEPSTGRRKGWRAAAFAGAVVLAATTVATPLAAVPASPETRAIAKPGDKRPIKASVTPAPDKADDGLPRGRRRGGSSPLDQRAERPLQRGKPGVNGEVEGGTGGPRAAPRDAKVAAPNIGPSLKPPCVRDAVQFERGFGGDAASVALTRCNGRPSSVAVEQLSILVRPMNVARPSALASRIRRAAHREWLPGVKRIHEGLVTRLQAVVDRFQAGKITLVSGYRPTSLGSFHQSARALDLHVEGVANDKLVEFCRTLPDTGCGYYPNSSFVHIDVRPAGTGHVYWIDASGPGEPARYVSSWPPRNSASATNTIAPPDPAAPLDEHTHAGAARPPLGGSDTKIDARTTAPWWGGESQENAFSP
jgi:hypothetical protein